MGQGRGKKAPLRYKDVKCINPIKQMAECCLQQDSGWQDGVDAGLQSRSERISFLISIQSRIPNQENNNIVKESVIDPGRIMEPRLLTLEDVKTVDKNVKRLLQTVSHTKWREPLQELWNRLQSQDQHLKMCHFMIEFFNQSVQHKTSDPTKDHPMEITHSPPGEVFCYNSWKSFVGQLGYDITEPDSNRDVRNSCCTLPSTVPKETLEGMGSLLTAMKEIPREVVISIWQMRAEDFKVMENILVSMLQPEAQKGVQEKIKQLPKRYKAIAKLLGVTKDCKDDKSCNTTNTSDIWLVIILLNGFHGNVELVELVSQV